MKEKDQVPQIFFKKLKPLASAWNNIHAHCNIPAPSSDILWESLSSYTSLLVCSGWANQRNVAHMGEFLKHYH